MSHQQPNPQHQPTQPLQYPRQQQGQPHRQPHRQRQQQHLQHSEPPSQYFAHEEQHRAGMPSPSSTSVMERVLFQLHLRSCHFGLRYLSASTRRLLEHLLLVVAIAGFGALILLHRNFVFRVGGSGSSTTTTTTATTTGSAATGFYNNGNSGKNCYNCAYACFASIPHLDPSADLYRLSILPTTTTVTQSYVITQQPLRAGKNTNVDTTTAPSTATTTTGDSSRSGSCSSSSTSSDTCLVPEEEQHRYSDSFSTSSTGTTTPNISYSYSLTKAYLLLQSSNHQSLLQYLNVQHIVVSPHDPHCFGEPFLQFLIHQCGIGYETIVWNWFVHLFHWQIIHREDNHPKSHNMVGYVYSTRTGQLQELRLPLDSTFGKREYPFQRYQEQGEVQQHQPEQPSPPLIDNTDSTTDSASSMLHRFQQYLKERGPFHHHSSFGGILSKLAVLSKTTFLFLFSTTLISFTLRETQERMLEFTQELSRRVSVQLAVGDLVVFHLIHNVVFVPIMVGMMFFLIEFYGGDKLLAFLVMTIVWCVEVFSVISLRSDQGITFFPRIFYLLFCLFHIYYFANPHGGFKYLALAVVGCFMLHSMAFFWHRFELPAVAFGRVTIDRPRYEYHAGAAAATTTTPTNADVTTASTSPVISRTLFSAATNDGRLLRVSTDNDPPSPPTMIRSQTTASSYVDYGNPSFDFPPILSPPSPRENPRPTTATPLPGMMFRLPNFAAVPTVTSAVTPATATAAVSRPQTASFSSYNDSSTQTSSTIENAGIFRRCNGIDNDDDDDDNENDHVGEDDSSSYVYFMQGEVVVHRPRNNNNSNNTSGGPSASAALLSTVESSHTLASTTSGQDQQQPPLPQLDTVEPGMFAELPDSNNDRRPADTIVYSSPDRGDQQQQQQGQESMYSGDDSKSGLQAILEFRLTPRHRNGTDFTMTTTTGSTSRRNTGNYSGPASAPAESYVHSLEEEHHSRAASSSRLPKFPELPS